ncbi:MAG TPA: hypothetical protein VNX68_07055 [Nitrosopumilaceae archaeon]|jgi:hypothetical protein|nr:hypothetical protein [Nitrosopumilaceae archaeon]
MSELLVQWILSCEVQQLFTIFLTPLISTIPVKLLTGLAGESSSHHVIKMLNNTTYIILGPLLYIDLYFINNANEGSG